MASGRDARLEARATERRKLVLFVLCASMFVIVVDNTILSVAIPTITRSLEASASQVHWIIDAYTLVFAGVLITGGSFADRYGRRLGLRIGALVFGIGSFLSAIAGSAEMLIGTRALMGLGAAMLLPPSLATIATLFPPSERGFAIGVWAATAGIASVAGPICGGILLEHFSWGAIFLVNVPLVALILAATFLLIPAGKAADPPAVDVRGAGLSIAALSVLLYGIIGAPESGWTSPRTTVAFGASIVLSAISLRYLLRSPHPLIDPRAFRDRRLIGATVTMGCLIFSMFASVYGLAQYFQFVLGYSPLRAGLTGTPVAVMMMAVSPWTGRLARRFGVRRIVGSGFLLDAIGLVLVAQLDQSASIGDIVWRVLFLGTGTGLATAPLAQTIIASFASPKAGVASGLTDTSRQVGGALGIAVIGSVTASIYADRIGEFVRHGPLSASTAEEVRRSIGVALDRAASVQPEYGDALKRAATAAFTDGFQWGMLAGALVFVVAAVIAAVTLPGRLPAREDRDETDIEPLPVPVPPAAPGPVAP